MYISILVVLSVELININDNNCGYVIGNGRLIHVAIKIHYGEVSRKRY
ncbi:hypothetical protein [Mediterraneibacter gnavus]|uniref:Uncharacterized protein n=1 Tax=Mediterraneibacter gnavus (strain CC55_001C) TaxID=1073375 RepID=A0A829NGM3_MEDG5|nr:hypothetical protein [Mediterraneibacter gnavus]ETD16325.1 hypothetical protein HMPREF1201_02806 [Mediterraneibacter gnavus CC55_001C]